MCLSHVICVFFVASVGCFCFFFNDTATTEIYTLSLHDALPILGGWPTGRRGAAPFGFKGAGARSEEHTSELQSLRHLVCRLLLEKKKKIYWSNAICSMSVRSPRRTFNPRSRSWRRQHPRRARY